MNIQHIKTDDMLNGEGLRVVMWVSGCEHCCKGCFNSEAWNFNSGHPYSPEDEAYIFSQLGKPYITGLTLSGGDPLHPRNISTIEGIIKRVKSAYPSKTIWIYTGYEPNDVQVAKISTLLTEGDVIVTGKFVECLASTEAHWVGSINQKLLKF